MLDALICPVETAAKIAAVIDEPVVEILDAGADLNPSARGRERAPRTIRLPLALIDQLMNGISDMVLARNDLARKMRDRGADPELEGSFERLSANVADLRDMISKTRMQRVDRLYAAIPGWSVTSAAISTKKSASNSTVAMSRWIAR